MKYLTIFSVTFLALVPDPVLVFDISSIGNSTIANKSRDKLEDLNTFFRHSLTYLQKRSVNTEDASGNRTSYQARKPRPRIISYVRGQPVSRHYYNIYIRDSPSFNFYHYLHSLGIAYPDFNTSLPDREGDTVNATRLTSHRPENFPESFLQDGEKNSVSPIGRRRFPSDELTKTGEEKITSKNNHTTKSGEKPPVGVSTSNSVATTPAEASGTTKLPGNQTKKLEEELTGLAESLKSDIMGGKALQGNFSAKTNQKTNKTDILIQIINLSPVILAHPYLSLSSTQNTSTDETNPNKDKIVACKEEKPEDVKIEESSRNLHGNRIPLPITEKASSVQFISLAPENSHWIQGSKTQSEKPVTPTSQLTANYRETEKFLMEPSTLVERSPSSIEYRVLESTAPPSKKQRQLYSLNDLIKLKKEYPAYGKHSHAEVLRSLKILDLKSSLAKKAKHFEQYGHNSTIL